jgi:chromosome segregation ATPase
MQREGHWDYMGRRLREERDMNNPLHLKLNDIERNVEPEIFTEVDILKKEIGELQKTLQNSFIKIKELRTLVDNYDKNCPNGGQLELNF